MNELISDRQCRDDRGRTYKGKGRVRSNFQLAIVHDCPSQQSPGHQRRPTQAGSAPKLGRLAAVNCAADDAEPQGVEHETPGGEPFYPYGGQLNSFMPSAFFSGMKPDDLDAIVAYLRTLKPLASN
jgi:hypothetical protein